MGSGSELWSGQAVIQSLGTLHFSVSSGTFAFPRAAALNAGIFSGSTHEVINAISSIWSKATCKVSENPVTIQIPERAKTLALSLPVNGVKALKAVCRTKVKRPRAFIVECCTRCVAPTQHMLVCRRHHVSNIFPTRMEINTSGFRQLLRACRRAKKAKERDNDKKNDSPIHDFFSYL